MPVMGGLIRHGLAGLGVVIHIVESCRRTPASLPRCSICPVVTGSVDEVGDRDADDVVNGVCGNGFQCSSPAQVDQDEQHRLDSGADRAVDSLIEVADPEHDRADHRGNHESRPSEDVLESGQPEDTRSLLDQAARKYGQEDPDRVLVDVVEQQGQVNALGHGGREEDIDDGRDQDLVQDEQRESEERTDAELSPEVLGREADVPEVFARKPEQAGDDQKNHDAAPRSKKREAG